MPASALQAQMASQVTAILLLILGWDASRCGGAGQAVMWLVLITALVSASITTRDSSARMITRDPKVADFESAKSAREKRFPDYLTT